MKIPYTPIKVIDTVLESPELWREFALSQEYHREDSSPWPGQKSNLLSEINPDLFSSFARKLITHCHGGSGFSHLEVSFSLVDETYKEGWLHQDEPHYNIAGLIYLNPSPAPKSGTNFYRMVTPAQETFTHLLEEEFSTPAESRKDYTADKQRQKSYFKKTMSVENEFNRCIMFHPSEWHGADRFFGTSKEDSRLTITFFGIWK
jgi:hypothetical protein